MPSLCEVSDRGAATEAAPRLAGHGDRTRIGRVHTIGDESPGVPRRGLRPKLCRPRRAPHRRGWDARSLDGCPTRCPLSASTCDQRHAIGRCRRRGRPHRSRCRVRPRSNGHQRGRPTAYTTISRHIHASANDFDICARATLTGRFHRVVEFTERLDARSDPVTASQRPRQRTGIDGGDVLLREALAQARGLSPAFIRPFGSAGPFILSRVRSARSRRLRNRPSQKQVRGRAEHAGSDGEHAHDRGPVGRQSEDRVNRVRARARQGDGRRRC